MYENRFYMMVDTDHPNFGQCFRFYSENNHFFELQAEMISEQTTWVDKEKVMEISEEIYEQYLEHYSDQEYILTLSKQIVLTI